MNRIKEDLLYYHNDGVQKHWVYRFKNNYGASIIKGKYANGEKFYPYELMAIKFDENDCPERIETSFVKANDVKGYLRIKDVKEYLDRIKAIEVENDC